MRETPERLAHDVSSGMNDNTRIPLRREVDRILWKRAHPLEDDAAFPSPLGIVHLVVNPPDDAGFAASARRLVAECRAPADLQELLRGAYPRAVVRAREIAGERPKVWYVYREGRWVGRNAR